MTENNKYLALAQKVARDVDSKKTYEASRHKDAERLADHAHDVLQTFDGLIVRGHYDRPFPVKVSRFQGTISVLVNGTPVEQTLVLSVGYQPERDRIEIATYMGGNIHAHANTRTTYGASDKDMDAALSQISFWVGERLTHVQGEVQ